MSSKNKGKVLPFTGTKHFCRAERPESSFFGSEDIFPNGNSKLLSEQILQVKGTRMLSPSSNHFAKHSEHVPMLDLYSEDALQASLTGVESDFVSELFGVQTPEVTPEEVSWLLKRTPQDVNVDKTVSRAKVTVNVEDDASALELPSEQLGEAKKRGTLSNLLEYRYKKETQLPVLEKIIHGFSAVMRGRLEGVCGGSVAIQPVRCVKAPFDVWMQLKEPVAVSLTVFPLEGTAVFGMDEELAAGLNHACFASGSYENLFRQKVTAKKEGEKLFQTIGKSVSRHLLHLCLLDLEWALAPYYEVEIFGSAAQAPVAYSKYFWLDDACICCELAVSIDIGGTHPCDAGAVSGTMMLMLPETMFAPLLSIFTGEEGMLVPELATLDRSVLEHFRQMANADFITALAAHHPLSAAVILSELPEDRRTVILESMPDVEREAVSRRLGHRARVEHVLTESQQFVASVLALGENHAAQVLSGFSPESAAGFLRAATKLPSLYAEQVTELLKNQNSSIISAGPLFVDSALVRRLMIRAIKPEQMHQVVSLCRNSRIYMPFALLTAAPPEKIAALLRHEILAVQHGVVLLLLATDREYTARIFTEFSVAERTRIAEQLVHHKRITPDLVGVLESYVLKELMHDAGKELLAVPAQERWAVSGTVEWLLDRFFVQ